ncbi:AraC-type DNA-binding protein [Flavobacterium aquidurense]|jgi:AraC-like DNA-binding protein|uniref:AraC family transcriptional regulator n=1 Tax=Flavobacterium frigidimaris TaxID=262320 RepID=A0ABX4BTM1_FLAFR|nr:MULTISPECIES: AraC family transcriptional regulator [Flavobacterium]OXA81062.1 AraC family transcriptional regulator [Flavobacterium frigidimaris]TDW46637.1 AraC-like DNA-binding protein [Flavobacterium sp. 270]SDZ58999.1 AraC-type DNA-binding protein [Flavobacterium aquidurense]
MGTTNTFHREIAPLSAEDSFLVFDRVKDNFDFPVHYHPEFEINFISNGKGIRRVVGDNIDEIEDVELVLIGPNLYHGWENHKCKNDKIHEITIQFHKDLFPESLLSRRIMGPINEMFNRANHGILFSEATARKLMPQLLKISKLDGMDYFLEITSILYDLANSRNQRLLSTYTVDGERYEDYDKMKVIYDYVQNNFQEKISLDEMANAACMSNASFNRFVKKRTGKTLVNYLRDIRIGYAARWLLEDDVSVSEVAYKSGFHSIANFNRTFKALKKCTPSQYRDDFFGMKRIL